MSSIKSDSLFNWLVILLYQVVFRSGQGALQVLPPLVDVIPEARLNLVIYHLRQGKNLCSNCHVCVTKVLSNSDFYHFCEFFVGE